MASASTRMRGWSPRTTRTPKSDGIVTTKATSPGLDQPLRLLGAVGDVGEAVVAGQLQRRDHRPAVLVVARGDEGGGQPLRVVVDGVAEEDEQDQRHAQHHGEGDPVAAHLDELLGEERARRRSEKRDGHAMLSSLAPMNWMKTSSRLVSAGRTRDAAPVDRGERRVERRRVAADHVQRGAEGRDLVDARRRAQAAGDGLEAGAGDVAGGEAGARHHLLDGALGDQAAVGDVVDAVAALGLVHVVGGDEHGHAALGQPVDLVPELAARLGVDAGGRLVEEQERRARA